MIVTRATIPNDVQIVTVSENALYISLYLIIYFPPKNNYICRTSSLYIVHINLYLSPKATTVTYQIPNKDDFRLPVYNV